MKSGKKSDMKSDKTKKTNEHESDMNSDKKMDKNVSDPFSLLSWGLEQALFYQSSVPQNSPPSLTPGTFFHKGRSKAIEFTLKWL